MKLVDNSQSLSLDLRKLVGTFWPALSSADLDWIQTREDRLLHAIVRTYGIDRLEAERQIFSFVKFIRWTQLEQRLRSNLFVEDSESQSEEVDYINPGERSEETPERNNRLSGPTFARKRNLPRSSRSGS